MTKIQLSCIIFCIVFIHGAAKNKQVASIPFQMIGTSVVLPIKINNSSTLHMILDTGLRTTIVTELLPGDSLDLKAGELKDMQGLGAGKSFQAYESDSNTIHFGKFSLSNKKIFAFKDELFSLSRQTGSNINGLIGSDFFRNYVVQIDYTNRRLRIYEPTNFIAPKGYSYMPMVCERQKMYIELSVLETDSARQRIKMLIDTGAELTAWFETLTNKAVSIPQKSVRAKIGEGLSGEITGVYARVQQLCIANFCVRNPIVAFPDSTTIQQATASSDRDGTIGSQLLSRFNLIIDRPGKKFYFKPNSNFNKPFIYNIAGIDLVQSDSFLQQPEISNVWPDSPAERVGLKVGDIISEINYQKTYQITIAEARHFFERPSTTPLTLTYERNGVFKTVQIPMQPKI